MPFHGETKKLADALRREQDLGDVRGIEVTRRLLDKAYPRHNPMDNVVMQEQVQRFAGDTVNIDPLKARYRPEHSGLNLKGFRVPEDLTDEQLQAEKEDYRYPDWEIKTAYPGTPKEYQYSERKMVEIPVEKGTINALGPENNRVELWGHEYRHQDLHDEYMNRKMDAAMASTAKEWDYAVDWWRDMTSGSLSGSDTRSDAEIESDLFKALRSGDTYGSMANPKGSSDTTPYWKQRESQHIKAMQTEKMLADALRSQGGK
jgi:hypothetical protein